MQSTDVSIDASSLAKVKKQKITLFKSFRSRVVVVAFWSRN
jgi:hypothetical protein